MNSSYWSNNSHSAPHPINTVIMVSNVVISLPSNSYIVWLIASGPKGKLLREFFQLNLSLFEVFYCFVCISFFAKYSNATLHLPKGLYHTLFWSGRPLLQCCICLEHFVAVVHPVLYLRYRTLRVKAVVAALAWTVILATINFYMAFQAFKEAILIAGCVAFMSVMLFCYACVFAALRKQRPGEGAGERDRSVKTRAIYSIAAILVSFSTGYLLWSATVFVKNVMPRLVYKREFNKACHLIISFCGLVQPLMYLRRRGKCSCRKSHREAK